MHRRWITLCTIVIQTHVQGRGTQFGKLPCAATTFNDASGIYFWPIKSFLLRAALLLASFGGCFAVPHKGKGVCITSEITSIHNICNDYTSNKTTDMCY